MREKFIQAQKMTRKMKAEYPEINYKTQFGICLSYVLKNNVDAKEEEIIDINTEIKTQKEFVQIIADMYEKKLLESDATEYENYYSAKRYTKVNLWREKRFYINSTVYEKRGANHKARERKQELGYVELKDGKLNFDNLEPAKLWIDYVYPEQILELAKTEFAQKK